MGGWSLALPHNQSENIALKKLETDASKSVISNPNALVKKGIALNLDCLFKRSLSFENFSEILRYFAFNYLCLSVKRS